MLSRILVSLCSERSNPTVSNAQRRQDVPRNSSQRSTRLEAFDPATNEYAKMATDEYDLSIENYRHETIAALESLQEADETAEVEGL